MLTEEHMIHISRDSSVSKVTGYGMDERGWISSYFTLHHRVQNGSRVHPSTCPVSIGVSFR